MAWYHQYQYAEVKHQLYPTLRGKALPITQYEIIDDPKKIVSVKVMVARGNYAWFERGDVILYRSGKDLAVMPEMKHSESFMQRLLRNFRLNKF